MFTRNTRLILFPHHTMDKLNKMRRLKFTKRETERALSTQIANRQYIGSPVHPEISTRRHFEMDCVRKKNIKIFPKCSLKSCRTQQTKLRSGKITLNRLDDVSIPPILNQTQSDMSAEIHTQVLSESYKKSILRIKRVDRRRNNICYIRKISNNTRQDAMSQKWKAARHISCISDNQWPQLKTQGLLPKRQSRSRQTQVKTVV